jgi:hypothetical protein
MQVRVPRAMVTVQVSALIRTMGVRKAIVRHAAMTVWIFTLGT